MSGRARLLQEDPARTASIRELRAQDSSGRGTASKGVQGTWVTPSPWLGVNLKMETRRESNLPVHHGGPHRGHIVYPGPAPRKTRLWVISNKREDKPRRLLTPAPRGDGLPLGETGQGRPPGCVPRSLSSPHQPSGAGSCSSFSDEETEAQRHRPAFLPRPLSIPRSNPTGCAHVKGVGFPQGKPCGLQWWPVAVLSRSHRQAQAPGRSQLGGHPGVWGVGA